MKSDQGKKFVYERCQLIEVICQLRYPTILSIDAKEPADFQDTVRENFPRYICRQEKVTPPGGEAQVVRNHNFISEDGKCKLSMTKNFIALSSMAYGSWEDFAHTLDEPLGQFIRLYKPAYFERVGLRYVNGFSREKLELQGNRWNDLFEPQYLGVLDDDSVDESSVSKCAVDVEMRLDDRCHLKLHAGPGQISRTVQTGDGIRTLREQETRFILDQDLFVPGNIKLPTVMETLDQLHSHADRVFSEAITDALHNAMNPVEL